MSPGPVFLLASAVALLVGPWSGLATSGSAIAGPAEQQPAVSGRTEQTHSYAALLEAADGAIDPEGVAALQRGVSLRGRDAASAARAFGDAATRLPALEDWALLFQAEALAKAGDTTGVRSILDRVEPGLVVVRGWRAAVDACLAARAPACAAAAATIALNRAPDASTRAAASAQLGRARLQAGDTAAAIVAFRVAIDADPSTDDALEAGRTLSALRTAPLEDRLLLGRLFFRHGNADRGTTGFDAWLAGARPGADREALRLELGRALYAARRYSAAEQRLAGLAGEATEPSIAAEARVLLGRTRLRIGRTDAGIALLRTAVADSATPAPARADALYQLADAEDDRGATGRARELYLQLIAEHAESAEAADAAMRAGGVSFGAARYAEAAGIFDGYRTAHASGPRAQQASWWAGQAHLMAGDTAAAMLRFAEAHAADPISLYGLRAADHVSTPLRTLLVASPAADDATARLASGAVVRIRLLRDAGLGGSATVELARARRFIGARPAGLYAIAEALNAGGLRMEAIRLGRDIRRGEESWNERLLRIVYPLPYRDEIVAAADRRGLNPWFVAGLIRQESLFLPEIRSSAGAVGLMQVMPATGRELARRDGLRGFSPSMLTDPDINIRLGTLFVAELLERHNGQLPLALAAYNAGPSRVTRWLRLPDNSHPDVFAERIPFPETRAYVRIVQQNARIYAELYGQQADGN